MKKKYLILLATLLLLLIIGVIYLNKKYPEKPFKNIDFPDSFNYVSNHTEDMKFVDTILYRGMIDLNIEGVFINVFVISDEVKRKFEQQNELNLEAHIVGNDPQYAIYLDDLDRKTAIRVISHELIHLQQYHSKRLINLGDGIVTWEGNYVDVLSLPYNERPWEREAFDKQSDLEKKLIKELY